MISRSVAFPLFQRCSNIHFAKSFNAINLHGRKITSPRKISKPSLNGVKYIVAVASAKGGVGKSTTAVNLAIGFSQEGQRVGLLDADIYGPSIPVMMNLDEKPNISEDKKLIPLQNYGIRCMSMGFMVPKGKGVVWRGPMVMGALGQMLRDTLWDPTDILVVDLPPGTGDAVLSLAQQVPLNGAVIVTSPQNIALSDVRRGATALKDLGVPLLGVVETFGNWECPNCHHVSHPFGEGGGQSLAEELGIPLLAQLPWESSVREGSDSGKPVGVTNPRSVGALAFRQLAKEILSTISKGNTQGPSITME